MDALPAPDFDAEIRRLLLLSELEFERVHRVEAQRLGVSATTLKRTVKAARKSTHAANTASRTPASAYEGRTLPVIRVTGGSRHAVVDTALTVMFEAGVPFYVRGTGLVRPFVTEARSSDGKLVRVPSILPLTKAMMGRVMGQTAWWQKVNLDGTVRRIDPPKEVTEQALDMVGEWPFEPIAGVVSTPTLRPDGSVLAAEGYDPATGLFLLALPEMPPMPEHPTKNDAHASLQLLLELLREFPFANAVGRSVGVSMLMTPVLRGGLLPAVPMHAATAPDAGTGKSYLADIASVIATGDRCYVQSAAPGDPKETEKRLVGAALAGYPIIALDNANGGEGLAGDFLCQLTERPALQIRKLGGSDMIRIPNAFTVIANGNSISLAADMVRRSLVAELDANMESPENRRFKGNPVASVLADRGRYIAACITIARAYIGAGRPGRLTALPSYEGWSDTVRSALVWLGLPDPVLSQAALRVEDPVRIATTVVFEAWENELGLTPNGHLTAELATAAEARWPDGDLRRPRLREALHDVAPEPCGDQAISTKRLGWWLRKAAKQVRHGLKLTADTTSPSRPRWILARNSDAVPTSQ